jgi:hypothetical protein
MYIERSECKTDKDIASFEYLKNILGSDQPTKVKINKFVKLLGLEGYRIDMLIGDDITVDNDHIELSFQLMTERERVNPTGRIFIHTTDAPNLDHLNPKEGNSAGTRTYPGKASFFWAIKANNVNEALKKIPDRYGRYSYQYIPNGSEDIFLDVLHNRISVKITDDVIPVFIQRNSAIPIRLIKESYIDETIERFDAFMEEFNLTHNEYIQEIKPTIEPEKPLTDKEKRLEEIRDRMVWHTRELSYSEYSKLRDEFSRLTGYPRDSVLNPGSQQLTRTVHNWNLTKFQGSKSPKKINVPPGTHFFHNSPNPNLVVSLKHFYSHDRMTSMFGVEYPEILYPYPRLYFYKEHVGGNVQGNAGEKVKSYDKNGMPIFDEKLKNGKSHCYMYISKPGDEFFYDPEMPNSNIVFLKLTKPIKLIKIY